MLDRRTVIRSTLALATGSALVGTAGSESAGTPDGVRAPYDAASVAGAETTVAAQVRPSALGRVPLPARIETRLSTLRDRFDSLSPSALGPARGSLALDGKRLVGGGLTLEGRFERSEVAGELTAGSFARIQGEDGIDFYRSESTPSVVGLGDESITVGYGPGDGSPLAHARAAIRAETESPTRLASIGDAVGGGSRAAATLGPETRSQALERIPSETAELGRILEEATAFAVGIDVAEGRSRVAYGADLDLSALSPATYWDVITSSAAQAEGFDLSAVERDDRIIVARGTVATDALWSVQADLLGLD